MNDVYPNSGLLRLRGGQTQEIRVSEAKSFFQRFMGLMGKKTIPSNCGLLFKRCTSIHMMFMNVPLDVVWLGDTQNGEFPVIGISRNVRPWTFANGPRGSRHAMEFAAGTFVGEPESFLLGS